MWVESSQESVEETRIKVNDTHHVVIPAPWEKMAIPTNSLLGLSFSVDKQFGSFHVASSDLN